MWNDLPDHIQMECSQQKLQYLLCCSSWNLEKENYCKKIPLHYKKVFFSFTALTYGTPNNEKIIKALYSNYLRCILI